MSKINLYLMAVLVVLISAASQAGVVRTQTFSSAPSGWTQVGTQVSFSNTNNTGGTSPAGEAGGLLPCHLATRVYYADTNLGGSFTLADAFSASGEFDITSNGTLGDEQGFVGFFDTNGSAFQSSIGFIIVDSSETKQRIRPYICYADGSDEAGPSLTINHNGNYTFDINWNPNTRTLTVRFYNSFGGLLATLTDTPLMGNMVAFGSVNAFGIGSGADNTQYGADATQYVYAYIDNVSYSAVNNPYSTRNPLPSDVLLGVDSGISLLDWDSPLTSGTYKYDVYLSTPPSTTPVLVSSNQSGTSYTLPSALSAGKTYYWRVATKNSSGTLLEAGATWQFTTSSTGAFKIVALPDTQGYSEDYPWIFTVQTQWIVNNKTSQKIEFVTHLGDVVDNSDQPVQWLRANTSMNILNGVVPYSICCGNHDYHDRWSPSPYKQYGAEEFIGYFGPSRYSSYSWYQGSSGKGMNHYQIFTAGGRQWLHLNLEFEPDDEGLLWAQRIIDANPTLPVILSTHSYLSSSGYLGGVSEEYGPDAGNGGESMWNKFVSHNDQIIITLNGHFPGNSLRISQNDYGHDVFQICTDYQSIENRGNGFLRTLEFDESNGYILAKSYSPYTGTYLTDVANQFTLPMNFATRLNSFYNREIVSTVQAGNVIVTDVSPTDPNVVLSIPLGQKTFGFSLGTGHERGQYYVQAGNRQKDDALGGIYIASVAQNGRYDPDCTGIAYHTVAVDVSYYGENFVCTSRTISAADPGIGGAASNVNFSAAYFPFSGGWTCGRVRSLDANLPLWCLIGSENVQLGVNLNQYPNSIEDPGFEPYKPRGSFPSNDPYRGVWTLTIPGVNSNVDGVLLVCGGKNEGNYANASPWEDGSGWVIAVVDNTITVGSTETDPFNFVYVPYETPGITAGRISGDGGIINGTISNGKNNFVVERFGAGQYRLWIDGYAPVNGALLLSSENEEGAFDNFISYQPDNANNCWIIQYKDLPNANLSSGIFGFVFVPFGTPPAAPGSSRVPIDPMSTNLLAGNFTVEWDNTNSIANVYKQQGSARFTPAYYNKGDYYLARDGYSLMNDDTGILLASSSEFFRQDDGSSYYPVVTTNPYACQVSVCKGGNGSNVEGNADFSTVWVTPYNCHTIGWNSTVSGLHQLGGASVTLTENYNGTAGRYKYVLSGVNSNAGIFFAQTRGDSGLVTSVMPLADGWEVTTRNNLSTATQYVAETHDYAFFEYMPTSQTEADYALAHIDAEGNVVKSSGPVFFVTKTGTGTYTIDIGGVTPENGTLIVQTYDGNTSYGANNVVMAYEPSGNSFNIRSFTLNSAGTAVDQDFVVLYIPFNGKVPCYLFALSDINFDGTVDMEDFWYITTYWLESGTGLLGDIHADNRVNLLDLAIMASEWTGQ